LFLDLLLLLPDALLLSLEFVIVVNFNLFVVFLLQNFAHKLKLHHLFLRYDDLIRFWNPAEE